MFRIKPTLIQKQRINNARGRNLNIRNKGICEKQKEKKEIMVACFAKKYDYQKYK